MIFWKSLIHFPCLHLIMEAPLSVETLFLQEAWIDRTGDSFTQVGEGLLLHVIVCQSCSPRQQLFCRAIPVGCSSADQERLIFSLA